MKSLVEYAASENIAELLSENELSKIGAEVVSNFNDDLQSRSEWTQQQEEALKLAAQMQEVKSYPWQNAANVKFPMLTEAAVQFNSRIYPALIPATNIVKGRVVGFDLDGQKQEKAIRVSKHMSWQLTEEMEEWEEDMDRALMQLPIVGCFFKKTYYDGDKDRNVSEAISAMDFVLDYYAKSVETCYRKTHVLYPYATDIKRDQLAGRYLDIDLGTPIVELKKPEMRIGHEPIAQDKSVPHEILEQHTFRDLDGDGLEEPYIFTVHRASQKVVRIVAGFDPDDIVYGENSKVLDVPQEQYFTKYGFIPNPDGSIYDVGFGQLLAPLNKAVDSLINQLLDAGTLSNLQSGFLSKGVRLRSGDMTFRPGEWKPVQSRGDDLRKGIFPLPVREPSNVLFQLLGLMINSGQRLASTIDSMVGENPGQNQKATTTLAVLDQGQKVFNGIYKRLHRSLKKELKKLYRLNSIYLPAQQYLNVLDLPVEAGQAEQIRRSDYDMNSIDVIPSADASVATQQQKLAKAQALAELLPLGTVNPQEVTQRMLEAQEQPAIERIMKVDPPQPDPEIVMKSQQLMDESQRAWADFGLRVIEAQQKDIQIQTNAILALAKAEAAEDGTQINLYTAQLKELAEKSRQVGEQAKLHAQSAKPKPPPQQQAPQRQ